MTCAFDSRSGQGRIEAARGRGLVDGTVHEAARGRELVDGTVHEAARGRGLVDGTVHYTGCVDKLNIQSPNSRLKKKQVEPKTTNMTLDALSE